MDSTFKRSALLFGQDALEALNSSCVVVVGCGGVGSFAIEALARSGIGKLVLIDKDIVEPSNINRQLCALTSTVDRAKTEIFKERIAQINPQCEVVIWTGWYDQELNPWLLEQKPDYVLDCIDSIGSKKDLIRFCLDHKIPLISSMGMARRRHPDQLKIMELEKTSGDPMAKILRLWKRKERLKGKVMTVCSQEPAHPMDQDGPLPSAVFVPSSAGILMASECTSKLIDKAVRQAEKQAEKTLQEQSEENSPASDPTGSRKTKGERVS